MHPLAALWNTRYRNQIAVSTVAGNSWACDGLLDCSDSKVLTLMLCTVCHLPLPDVACCADLRFRDTPSGMCDQRPFEAVVTSYYALVAPDSPDTIWDMCLTVHEVGFITNEVSSLVRHLFGCVGVLI